MLVYIQNDRVNVWFFCPTFLLRKVGEVKGEKPLSPFANGETFLVAKFYFTIFTRNDGSALSLSTSERADEPNNRISSPLNITFAPST